MSALNPRMRALEAELREAIWRDHRRRQRRRRAARTVLASSLVALALSGSALAAGEALGLMDLGNGVIARRIPNMPASGPTQVMSYTGCDHQCTSRQRYVYRVSGGHTSRSFGGITCAATGRGFSPRSVYVSSSRRLSDSELKDAIDMVDGSGPRSLAGIPHGTIVEVKVCKEARLPVTHSSKASLPTR